MTAATLLDLFDEVLTDSADVEAFVEIGPGGATRRITFEQWATAADAAARTLIGAGVGPGDVVAIALPSGIDYAVAYQAVVRAGAIATGINPRLGSREVAHILDRCAPALVIDRPVEAAAGPGDPAARHLDTATTDPVAIVWTGGTTGVPKGAWFDHAGLRAMAEGAAPLSAPGDRRLSPLPFAHVGYMTRAWDELAHRITTVVVPTPWTAAAALDLIDRERVTVCQGVPTQYRLMLDHPRLATCDTSHLRLAGIGAARIPPELVAEMTTALGCPVVVRYASTEASLATGTRLTDDAATVCSTVGRPNGGVELRVVDDAGAPAGVDEVGHVLLRSRAMMRGYWNDPEATKRSIDEAGWMHSGDLATLDEEGYVHIVGRLKDMIIRGGENIYPREIEAALHSHPAVADAQVVGVPSRKYGEEVMAWVKLREGARADEQELKVYCCERMASFKVPRYWRMVETFPMTVTGKVQKFRLREMAIELLHREEDAGERTA